jgi:hypothetical protein
MGGLIGSGLIVEFVWSTTNHDQTCWQLIINPVGLEAMVLLVNGPFDL